MTAAYLLIVMLALPADAQSPGQDTLRLESLQRAALRTDPRAAQLSLREAETELRLRDIASERLPALTAAARAVYQSDVPSIPVDLPGFEVPRPPRHRYDAALEVEQLVYDGGALGRRRAVEEAGLRVERARIGAELHPLRTEVNGAFFRALLLQERMGEMDLLIQDLDARLALVRSLARGGAALPGDTAVVRAELLRAMQSRLEVAADRRAALSILGELVGRRITEADVLAVPDLATAVATMRSQAVATGGDPRVHPRYEVYEAQRQSLAQQASLIDAGTRPRVLAFGQLGYGRPGLQQFTDDFQDYWTAGLRFQWRPWTWGSTGRQREVLRLQREVLSTEEAAFSEQLRRQTREDLERMDHLEAALALDDRIIALREQVERQARAQLAERAITPAAYVDIRTDLLEARVARQRHRIELAAVRARYLTTLGVVLET